jgi:uncharacterized protein
MIRVKRELQDQIPKKLQPNKVVVITGARRVGKTFLLKDIISKLEKDFLFLNGEDINTHLLLKKRSVENYRNVLGSKKILIIDEAQKLPEIGSILKLIVDGIDGVMVIVTGSSAFDILNLTGDPLTGRKHSFILHPFSVREYAMEETALIRPDRLMQRLIYGNYPELLHIEENKSKQEYLNEIVSSYLLRDILSFENIRNSEKIINLLRLVAFQTGGLVSLHELGRQIGISKNTVEKYLDLLSKVFVLFKIEGFSRNLRKEITKSSKWYFYDNGIRNAVIANFNMPDLRSDTGQLWENFLASERLKHQQYKRLKINNFFWRTYDHQEIDWIEEESGNLHGFEFKMKNRREIIPAAWKRAYPSASYRIISPENYFEWLG